jgi:hypothetical protein
MRSYVAKSSVSPEARLAVVLNRSLFLRLRLGTTTHFDENMDVSLGACSIITGAHYQTATRDDNCCGDWVGMMRVMAR